MTETDWPAIEAAGIAHGTVIGVDVTLARGVVIGSGVVLGDRVRIGPNTCIANTTVGANTSIGANCTIGLPGFGYEKDADGRYWRFPHVGRVEIGMDVEIGSNSCIDRGALGSTRIGRGVKVDNLVHIAHNVTIGENALIIANSMIGGSTQVGPRAWIAPSASIMNQLSIGADAVIGMGAVVVRNVGEAAVVMGNPARPRAGTT
jgi:UDP-3-O-[3-hydroxymyristoyl] glucosamine N-acyltransferase